MICCRSRKGKGGDDDGKPKIPDCMVTFADMITLMVTFFILLCTFAKSQDATFFADGIGSFRRAIESMGLPGIMPSNSSPIALGSTRPANEPSRNPGRQERWIRLRDRLLEESPDTLRASLLESLQAGARVILPARVPFAAGSAELPAGGRGDLDEISKVIAGWAFTVEVVAFGDAREPSLSRGLELGVRRARVVARYLSASAGIDSAKIELSGLKRRERGATIENQEGDEILLRLKRP